MLSAILLALQSPALETRSYSAWLETSGGALSFGLELSRPAGAAWRAFWINGEERIEVPKVEFGNDALVLDMPHYDSRIHARVVPWSSSAYAQRNTAHGLIPFPPEEYFEGTWEKRRGAETIAQVPFRATRSLQVSSHFAALQPSGFDGRWSVDFETDDQLAVAVLESDGRSKLGGTFLTATGDYRYLSGSQSENALTLACFDGAHAFLFKAQLQPDGTLRGDFWSGNWHHETWTAKRDASAELADPFAQTKWNGKTKLADLAFPDLDGKRRTFGEFAGRPALLVVFGSWCPNCNDEAVLLKALDAKYRARGLETLGLAFELTGEPARDAEQVRIFARRHELTFPFFLCGTADKDEATRALGLVDRVRAFPTTIFVGADGLPKAVHSGFAGPATGAEHEQLVRDFEARIEALLGAR